MDITDYEDWGLDDDVNAECPNCGGTVHGYDRTVGALLTAIDNHEHIPYSD
jgi:hypothetical protein